MLKVANTNYVDYSIENADQFMERKINELAAVCPYLCDESGRGFWPLPAVFPCLLSRSIDQLQNKISSLYVEGQLTLASQLSDLRNKLVKLAYKGDLGEDHTIIFLHDHPEVENITIEEYAKLPFLNFCQKMMDIEEPIIMLGALLRNEEGALGELNALLQKKIIREGKYSRIHQIEEALHAKAAVEIREQLSESIEWKKDFFIGMKLHDQLYADITTRAGAVTA